MFCDWKNKKNSKFYLKVPPQVQNNFEYEDWIPISLIASLTKKNGYTKVTNSFLSSKINNFSEYYIENLLKDLENRGYIQRIFIRYEGKIHRTIVLTAPLYEMFRSIDNNMHEPTQP